MTPTGAVSAWNSGNCTWGETPAGMPACGSVRVRSPASGRRDRPGRRARAAAGTGSASTSTPRSSCPGRGSGRRPRCRGPGPRRSRRRAAMARRRSRRRSPPRSTSRGSSPGSARSSAAATRRSARGARTGRRSCRLGRHPAIAVERVEVLRLPVLGGSGLDLQNLVAGLGPAQRTVGLVPIEPVDVDRGRRPRPGAVVDPRPALVDARRQDRPQRPRRQRRSPPRRRRRRCGRARPTGTPPTARTAGGPGGRETRAG